MLLLLFLLPPLPALAQKISIDFPPSYKLGSALLNDGKERMMLVNVCM